MRSQVDPFHGSSLRNIVEIARSSIPKMHGGYVESEGNPVCRSKLLGDFSESQGVQTTTRVSDPCQQKWFTLAQKQGATYRQEILRPPLWPKEYSLSETNQQGHIQAPANV
jgi:hypothetical protein